MDTVRKSHFHLGTPYIFILICFDCTGVRTTATEWRLNAVIIIIMRINIRKMDLQEVEGGCGDWIDLTQDRDRRRALVSTIKNLRVP
jgi:hypothetical protein